MKCSPVPRTESQFAYHASLPWRRLPCRSSSPWIGLDPGLESDCSAAYKAFRLVMLTLFALFGAGSRAQAQSNPHPGSLETMIEAQERQIAQLKGLVLRQAQELQSQQQLLDGLLKEHRVENAVAIPALAAGEDKRDSAHLAVNRTHAPPQTKNLLTEHKSGFDAIEFHGLLQAWSSGGNLSNDTFRIRCAELKFTGTIRPKLKWTVMFDPSRLLAVKRAFTTVDGQQVLVDAGISQPSRMLQDAYLSFDQHRSLRFKLGQFKVPLSLKGQYANAELPIVEKALFMSDRARGGDLADVRDIGAVAWGALASTVEYQVGIFNGAGDFQNQTDTSDRKEVAGRIVARMSRLDWLQIGTSGCWSSSPATSVVDPRRNRQGAELLLRPGKLTFICEVMRGEDGAIRRIGGYAHLAYRFDSLEPVVRFDYFDPNTSSENSTAAVTERDSLAGLNYYLHEKHAKVQINYLRKTFTNEVASSRNLVLINLQTMW